MNEDLQGVQSGSIINKSFREILGGIYDIIQVSRISYQKLTYTRSVTQEDPYNQKLSTLWWSEN